MTYTPDSLRAKWASGIDEDDPNYSFIGVEGGSICWVENDDADAFRKVVGAHNATVDAWEAEVAALRERLEVAEALAKQRLADLNTHTANLWTQTEVDAAKWRAQELASALASLPSVVPSSDDVGTTHDPPEPDYQPDGSPEPNHRRSAQRAVGRFADPDEPCPPGDYD